MAPPAGTRAAVFLDRDDTLMVDVPYCRDPADVRLLEGSAQAVRRFCDLGFLVVLVTNQSGIARGLFTRADLDAVSAELRRQLAAEGAHLDGLYYCPHHPTAGCACRKPGTLLFETACSELAIDPGLSYVVGDRGADIAAGARIGSGTVLIRNERGLAEVQQAGLRPTLVCGSLLEFASWLQDRTGAGPGGGDASRIAPLDPHGRS